MKKRVLFSACALAACFAACTNDDFQTEQNNTVINEAGEVIGADLVSSGMKMNINDGSADTRINENGQWETGDQIGLGWYKYKTAIDKEQLYSDWASGSGWTTDNNLYANILFTLQSDGWWQTQADVYQGAYFAYWPFQRMTSGSKLKVVAPNDVPQTDDSFKSDVYKNSLYLSAQDFIEYADVDESTMTLESEFVLSPMVNAIGVVATPEAKIASDYLKSMIITEMQISVGGSNNNIITPSATLSPRYLPKTINDDGSARGDKELREELDKAAVAATGTSKAILTDQAPKVNYLRTAIANNNFTLAKNNTLRAFAFPFQKGATYTDRQFPSVKVTVKSANGDWKLGTFAVNNTNSETLATNLKQMFDDAQRGEKFSMVQNILGEPGSRGVPQTPESMTANLTVKDFTPATSGIKTVKHWNDLVTLVNELENAGKVFANNQVVFTLGGDLNFIENGEQLKTPDNVDIVLNTGSRKLVINGEVEWPAHLITNDTRYTTNIVVNEGATLKVGIDRNEVVNLIASSIENNGTIKAGAKASISADKNNLTYGNKLENNNMVIVEFGAYVYPAVGQEGIIAYEMDNNEPNTIGEINTLMELESSNSQKGYAQINTLILSNGVELDLNAQARAAGEGNRYEEGSNAEYLNSLENIDIIMRGASIVRKAGGKYSKVADITVEEGANTITDVEPQGNIDILKGSELTLASEIAIPLVDDGTPLVLADDAVINNEGTLYVNNTTTTKDFINKVGTVKVESDEKLYYVDQYIQGGIADGTVEKSSDPNAALAQEVKSTFDTYAAAISAVSLDDVVTDLNSKGPNLFDHLPGSDEPWASAAFYMALSEWMKAVTGEGLAESGTPTAISVQMLTLFQSQSGIILL
ncbi:hypothetical protein M3090_00925 [Bacteroides sp. ET71]|uniref:hypothetical protein n=1 Tax=Bacteroides sp. ET71 TaxID=2939421 RepID=UPI002012B2DA|nr:hypothetical protein [Bacteroides sp. ET71]MCL1614974.1 hypothetical protein [Bacteroides sp. ET71]